MVWSNWKAAGVVLAGLVVLAWSLPSVGWTQARSGNRSGKSERHMTVHENGVSYRCRIIASWRQPDGSHAFQLQDMASGKMMSIVESGPAREVAAGHRATPIRALPMRIFHWRDQGTPPAGAPVSPHRVTWQMVPPGSAAAPAPVSPMPNVPKNVVSSTLVGPERVIWWEEGKAPPAQAATTPTAHQATATAPIPVVPSTATQSRPGEKVVTWEKRPTTTSTRPTPPVISTTAAGSAGKAVGNKVPVQQASGFSPPSHPDPGVGPTMQPFGSYRYVPSRKTSAGSTPVVVHSAPAPERPIMPSRKTSGATGGASVAPFGSFLGGIASWRPSFFRKSEESVVVHKAPASFPGAGPGVKTPAAFPNMQPIAATPARKTAPAGAQMQMAQGTTGFRPRTVFQKLFGSSSANVQTAQAKTTSSQKSAAGTSSSTLAKSTPAHKAPAPISPGSLAKANPTKPYQYPSHTMTLPAKTGSVAKGPSTTAPKSLAPAALAAKKSEPKKSFENSVQTAQGIWPWSRGDANTKPRQNNRHWTFPGADSKPSSTHAIQQVKGTTDLGKVTTAGTKSPAAYSAPVVPGAKVPQAPAVAQGREPAKATAAPPQKQASWWDRLTGKQAQSAATVAAKTPPTKQPTQTPTAKTTVAQAAPPKTPTASRSRFGSMQPKTVAQVNAAAKTGRTPPQTAPSPPDKNLPRSMPIPPAAPVVAKAGPSAPVPLQVTGKRSLPTQEPLLPPTYTYQPPVAQRTTSVPRQSEPKNSATPAAAAAPTTLPPSLQTAQTLPTSPFAGKVQLQGPPASALETPRVTVLASNKVQPPALGMKALRTTYGLPTASGITQAVATVPTAGQPTVVQTAATLPQAASKSTTSVVNAGSVNAEGGQQPPVKSVAAGNPPSSAQKPKYTRAGFGGLLGGRTPTSPQVAAAKPTPPEVKPRTPYSTASAPSTSPAPGTPAVASAPALPPSTLPSTSLPPTSLPPSLPAKALDPKEPAAAVAQAAVAQAAVAQAAVAQAAPPKEELRVMPANPPKKQDWRFSWGKAKQPHAQTPGKPAIEQAAHTAKPVPVSTAHDILFSPERFNPAEKAPPAGPETASTGLKPKHRDDSIQQTAHAHAAHAPTANAQAAAATGQYPAGSSSVFAARNGLITPVTYVPVPVVTVPNPLRPPAPPPPEVPQAPNANYFVNAFTPPPTPGQNQHQPGQQNVHQVGYRPSMMNPAMLAQAYAQNPYLANPQLLMQGVQQYAQLPPPHQAMVQQAMFMQQQNMLQQQQALMQQQGPLNYQQNYAGPMPPSLNAQVNQPQPVNPQPVAPVQYLQPPMSVGVPHGYSQAPAPTMHQLIQTLVESPYPGQREWAATTLATMDWRHHPQVLNVLLQAARQDPAATVRAGCVYSLSRMNARVEPVVATFHVLQNDPDPRVRHEVQQAYERLKNMPN